MKQRSDPQPDLPHNIEIFLDRNIASRTLVETMRKAQITKDLGLKIHSHIEIFQKHNTTKEINDAAWLSEIGRRKWPVITRDLNIQYNAVEKQAVIDAEVALFALTSKQITAAQQAQIVIKALPAILRFINANSPPYIVKVYKDSTLSTPINIH